MYQGVVASVGKLDALTVAAIAVQAHAWVDDQCIAFAINTYPGSAGSGRQQVGVLAHTVMAAVDVQTQAQQSGAVLAGQIGCTFGIAGIKALCVHNVQAITVNRSAKKLCPVKGVADILHDSQFGFHEAGVVTIILVAHHAVAQFDVAHVVAVNFRIIPKHFDGYARHRPLHDLRDVRANQVNVIPACVEGFRVVRVIATFTQNGLPRTGRATVVVNQQRGPAVQPVLKIRLRVVELVERTAIRFFDRVGQAQAVGDLVNGGVENVIFTAQRCLADSVAIGVIAWAQSKIAVGTPLQVCRVDQLALQVLLHQRVCRLGAAGRW